MVTNMMNPNPGQEANFTYAIHTGHVLLNEALTPHIKRIRIAHADVAGIAKPGQFVNVKTADNSIPLLRRPFSIHRTEKQSGWFELLYQVIGAGTEHLARFSKDDAINFLGPLGNSFTLPESCDHAILIAGGLGIAPLNFWGQYLASHTIPTTLLWGNRSKDAICCLADIEQAGMHCLLATDDGALGFKGFVTDLLAANLDLLHSGKTCLFACGPNVMLNKVKEIAATEKIPCQFSLETMMACGFGVCLGCNVKSTVPNKPYLYVCKDGPVFQSSEISLGE
ncbi:MAG: dihydroorotate dehydrogenase electron transfer subunit [Candidatus Zhuqueibacterota bacterium]